MSAANANSRDSRQSSESGERLLVITGIEQQDGLRGVSVSPRARPASEPDSHLVAVGRSLAWAQESADRGDYLDALGWIGVVEAIGEELSAVYQERRQAWSRALVEADRRAQELG